jgi:prephenate dehydrogenase
VTAGGPRLPVLGGAHQAKASPAFERIAIVGLGAVGGSMAMALRRAWPRALVIGVDAGNVVETAIRLHAIDVGAADLMIAGGAELVIVSTGTAEAAAVLPHLVEAIQGEAAVLVIATPDAVAGAAAVMPARFSVAAGLPSVMPQAPGIQAASADLFQGKTWPLAAVAGHGARALDKVRDLVRVVGAEPIDASL